MRRILLKISIFTATLLLAAQSVEGHGWRKNAGCSGPSCGHRRCEPTFRRHFDYHRRQLARQDAMDSVLDKIINKFDKLNYHVNRNALVRQQGRRNSFDDASLDMPFSMEDYGEVGLELSLEVPGVKKGDIAVEFERASNRLVIFGRRYRREQGFVSQSAFSRPFQLDDDIDVNGIEVMLESGILTITLPRREKIGKEARKNIPISFVDDNDEESGPKDNTVTSDMSRKDHEEDDKGKEFELKEADEASEASVKKQKRGDITKNKERWDDDFIVFEDDPNEWV